MKVLITGGAGFIGYHLGKLLIEKGYNVYLTDIIEESSFDHELKDLVDHSGCQYIKCNLLEHDELTLLKNDYDFIVHLAAIVGVENVTSNSYGVLVNNQKMLCNILELAKDQSLVPKFVFASTSEVYAGSQFYGTLEYPTTEKSILSLPDLALPRTSYMLSKIYGEAMCHSSGLNSLILRPHNIYGPRMGMKHVIPQLIKKIINTPKDGTLDVFSPDHTRTFCYVKYAVGKISNFMENSLWSENVINLGVTEPELKIRELASILLQIAQREDIKINEMPNTAGSPSRRVPDTNLLSEHTEKAEIPSIMAGVSDTFSWYKSRLS